tara:strand:- start:3888 stop:4658 length:771 start_codon:yes stop_codon:yes gene_type:complete
MDEKIFKMKLVDTKEVEGIGKLYKCEHEESPMLGIEGKPFKNFTKYTLDWDWQKLDNEICLMLAKNPLDKWPKVGGSMPPELNQYGKFEDEALMEHTHDIPAGFTQNEVRKFFYFKHRTNLPWFFVVDVKESSFADNMNDTSDWNDSLGLGYLKECVYNDLPFKEIGRCVIYGSWANSIVPCHRDTLLDKEVADTINFHPGGYRPVYVYDSLNKQKFYVPEGDLQYKAYSYNTKDYHGVDSMPYFSYTVRVDGKFK